jgi:hypothetical protein
MKEHNSTPLFSDALERAYMHATLSDSRPLSITRGIVKSARFVGRIGAKVLRIVGRHMAALNDARARDVRFTHSQW